MSEPPADPPADRPRGLPPVDPVRLERSMRGIYSALLILQALVVLLVPRTIAQFGPGLTPFRLTAILTLVALLIALCAFIKRPWAYAAGWVLQVWTLGIGFWVSAMFFVGGVFALLWFFAGRIHRDLRARAAEQPPEAPAAG